METSTYARRRCDLGRTRQPYVFYGEQVERRSGPGSAGVTLWKWLSSRGRSQAIGNHRPYHLTHPACEEAVRNCVDRFLGASQTEA